MCKHPQKAPVVLRAHCRRRRRGRGRCLYFLTNTLNVVRNLRRMAHSPLQGMFSQRQLEPRRRGCVPRCSPSFMAAETTAPSGLTPGRPPPPNKAGRRARREGFASSRDCLGGHVSFPRGCLSSFLRRQREGNSNGKVSAVKFVLNGT